MLVHLITAAALSAQPVNDPVVQNRLDRNPPAPKVRGAAPKRFTTVASAGADVAIRRIDFAGVEAPAGVAEAARSFIGRPATKAVLTALADALSSAYESSNIALYTVSIPDQDVRDGVIEVTLIEGFIGEVQVRAADGEHPLLRKRASKLAGQDPLLRSNFERQSALIQSIPGLTLESSFENPDGDNQVTLVVEPRQKRVEAAVGIDNRGPHLLGDTILQAGVDIYGTAVDGDRLALSAYATPNLRNYRAFDGSYAIPIGSDGLTLTAMFGKLWNRGRKIDIRGKATFAGVTLAYPLRRSAKSALDVSVGLDGVNSDNALFGSIFSTERTRALRGALAMVLASGKTTVQGSAVASKGQGILGADVGDTGADRNFGKLNLAAAIEHGFTPRLIGRASGLIQLTSSPLPASELFTVGGATIGRAFDSGLLSGDKGVGGFAEIAFRPIRTENFKTSEAYVFADAASLNSKRRPLSPRVAYDLASAGAGIRARFKDRMQFGVEYAAVLNRPSPAFGKKGRVSVFYSVLF